MRPSVGFVVTPPFRLTTVPRWVWLLVQLVVLVGSVVALVCEMTACVAAPCDKPTRHARFRRALVSLDVRRVERSD